MGISEMQERDVPVPPRSMLVAVGVEMVRLWIYLNVEPA